VGKTKILRIMQQSISIVEMVFNRLSNVRLLGMDARPQANASLWLY
jgi:hypothetical protein